MPPKVTWSITNGDTPGDGNINIPYVTGDELDISFQPTTLGRDFPGIDAGNGDVAPENDIRSNPRTDDPSVANTGIGTPDYTDIGPFEYQPE